MKKLFLILASIPFLLAAKVIFPSDDTPVIPANMPLSSLTVKDGVMALPSGKYLYSRPIALALQCSEFNFLECEIKSSKPVVMLLGIYWAGTADKGLSEDRKMVVRIPVTEKWNKFYLPLASAGWQGTLKNFRLDFSVPAGVAAEVKSIRFVKDIANAESKALTIFPGAKIENHTFGKFQCDSQLIKFTMRGSYGYTRVVPVHYAAEKWRYLKVVFRAPKAASVRVSTYFATAVEPKLSDDRSATKIVTCSDQFQTVILDLNAKGHHKGIVTGMRFDFGVPAGKEVEVKSIELVSDPTEALPLGWERGINSSCSNFITTLASGKVYLLSNAAPGSKLQFFDAVGRLTGNELAVNGNAFEFHLPETAAMCRIVSPGNVPEPFIFDTGRYFTPWQAKWIAHAGRVRSAGRFIFRREIELKECRSARVQLTADDGFIFRINGRIAAEKMDDWHKVSVIECTSFLNPGKNLLEVEAVNSGDWGGLLFEGFFEESGGQVKRIISDRQWKLTDENGVSAEIKEIGTPPVAPWGKMAWCDLSRPLSPEVSAVPEKFVPLPPQKMKILQTGLGNRVTADAEVLYLCGFKASYSAPDQLQEMTRNGIMDFHGAKMVRSDRGSVDFSRRDPAKLDFSGVEDSIREVLQINPRARLLVSVGLDAPEWFNRDNPQDITKLSSGASCRLSSPASEKLMQANRVFLQKFITHLEKSPYAGNIIAYRAVSQCDGGEYQYYSTWRQDFDGYSPAMLKKFRDFLRKKYQNDPEKLSRAWGRKLTFEQIQIPSPAQRRRCSLGTFRDPVKEADVLDFIDCQAEVMVDWALDANRIIRKAAPDKLIASYGGYVMFYMQPQMEKSGHLFFNRLLDSGLVNLYTPPQDYSMREIGSPAGSMVPHGSVRLRGQKIYSENDSRTHFGGKNGHCHAASLFEDIGLLKRDFAFNLLTDSSSYFYDMTANWFADKRLIDQVGEFNRIGKAAQKFSTRPDTRIAVFMDSASVKLISPRASGFSALTARLLRKELYAAGGGLADEYYLSDILRDDFPAEQYKVLVFPNIYAPTPEICRAIEKKFKHGKRTLVFGYGAGMFRNGRLDRDGMKQLTGMDFRIVPDKAVELPEAGKVSPAVYPAESRTVDFGSYRSIYLPQTSGTREQWRKILQDAGVHIYNFSGDLTGCNGRFLSIHAASAGEKRLFLPKKSCVYDIFRKKMVLNNGTGFSVRMLRGETNIYFIGSPAEWDSFKGAL